MMNKTFSRLLMLLTLVVLLCAASAARPIQEPVTAPDIFFPPIGGVRGELLRFSVVSPPVFRTVPSPCLTTLSFVDLEGRPIGPSQEVRLSMGESAFVDLDFSTLVASFGLRAEVRPVLKVHEGSGPCIPSAEIFNPLTGRTSVGTPPDWLVMGYSASKQVTLDIGIPGSQSNYSVGGGLGQKVRFGMVRVTSLQPNGTSLPCRGEMGFRDSRGNIVGSAQRVDLAPGQGTFLDLNLNTLVSNFGERVGITPVLNATPDDSKGCVCSIQVVDQLSGRTSVYYGNAVVPPTDSQ